MSSPKLYRHVWVWTRLAVSARVSTIAVGVAIRKESRLVAHRVVWQRRSNLVAFGAKRTFSEPRLQN